MNLSRTRKPLIVGLALTMLTLPGCPLLDAYYRSEMADRLDPWLGRTLNDRIKAIGIPAGCLKLNAEETVCEWTTSGVSGGGYVSGIGGGHGYSDVSSYESHVMYVYGPDNKALSWSYRGSLGQFSSQDR